MAEQIIITDNMRTWALALVGIRKKNQAENPDLSPQLIDMVSMADACKEVGLTDEEQKAIRELGKQGRLEELAI
jgi:hypothetical protein